jgi:hypothetical protein
MYSSHKGDFNTQAINGGFLQKPILSIFCRFINRTTDFNYIPGFGF